MSFISVLCAMENSFYYSISGLDVWNKDRDAYFFTGTNPVIVHPPCQQWSRMKAFARPDPEEKELAFFCLQKVLKNGGVFEHPKLKGSRWVKSGNPALKWMNKVHRSRMTFSLAQWLVDSVKTIFQ